jgi:hypothetical protein
MHAVAEAMEVAMYSTTKSTEAVYDIREARKAVKKSTLFLLSSGGHGGAKKLQKSKCAEISKIGRSLRYF